MGEAADARRFPFSGKALFAVTAWGASFVATRIALESFEPLGLVGVRLALGALLLAGLLAWRGTPLVPERADRTLVVVLGLILGGHLLIQAHGLRHTSAINTGWIIGFIPATIAVGAWIFLRRPIRPLGWVGLALGTGGVLLVSGSSPAEFVNARFGDALQLLSCFTWTAYTLVAVRPVARSGALRVTVGALVTAALVLTAAATADGFLTGPVTVRTALAVAFLGLVCSGLALGVWLKAIDEHGPTTTGALLYLEPFVTVAVAAAVIDEPVTGGAVAGGVLVLVGVWLVGRGAPTPLPE